MAARQDTSGSFMGELLEEAVVQEFAANLRGRLLRPEDDGYDTARAVVNGMIDRHPALIARCAGVADVIRGVDFARIHNLPLLVRGGLHNVAGNAVCDGGVMIDLSPMKGMPFLVSWAEEARELAEELGYAR